MIPSPLDRRLSLRRVRSVRISHPDRRSLADRRMDALRARLYFPPSERSWLCFESADVKRRLSPIPSDWTIRDDAELEALCAQAESAGRPGREPA